MKPCNRVNRAAWQRAIGALDAAQATIEYAYEMIPNDSIEDATDLGAAQDALERIKERATKRLNPGVSGDDNSTEISAA